MVAREFVCVCAGLCGLFSEAHQVTPIRCAGARDSLCAVRLLPARESFQQILRLPSSKAVRVQEKQSSM